MSKTNEERIAELETKIRNGRECLALRRRPGMSPMIKEANEIFERMINSLEEELEQLRKAQRVWADIAGSVNM